MLPFWLAIWPNLVKVDELIPMTQWTYPWGAIPKIFLKKPPKQSNDLHEVS